MQLLNIQVLSQKTNTCPLFIKSRKGPQTQCLNFSVELATFSHQLTGIFVPAAQVNPFIFHVQNLNTQYHPQPTAFNIEAAIKFAAERNKLLLVNVHRVETTDSFLTNVLCSRQVCNFITENYIFWGVLDKQKKNQK